MAEIGSDCLRNKITKRWKSEQWADCTQFYSVRGRLTCIDTDPKKRPSFGHLKPKSLAKANVNYWRHRLEQTVNCTGSANPLLSVRVAYKGRQRFDLETSIRDAAATKSVAIYRFTVEAGREAVSAKYKPDGAQSVQSVPKA